MKTGILICGLNDAEKTTLARELDKITVFLSAD
jgi:hypothetical protein